MNSPDEKNIDPALLELFRAELDAHIPVLSEGLLELEKGRVDEQGIAGMMRAAHSIKGAARIVGVEAAVRVAHVLEDCLTAARDGRIRLTSAAVDVLLQGVDALQRVCALQADPGLNETELAALLERIAAIRDGQTPAAAQDHPPLPPEVVEPVPCETPPDAAAERCLTLPADVDDAAVARLRAELCVILSQGARRIRLDFAQVNRLSAAALALFASFAGEAARTEPAPLLAAEHVGGALATLLRVTGLDRAWPSNG